MFSLNNILATLAAATAASASPMASGGELVPRADCGCNGLLPILVDLSVKIEKIRVDLYAEVNILGLVTLKVTAIVKAFLAIVAVIKAAVLQLQAIVVVSGGTVTITAQAVAEALAKIIINIFLCIKLCVDINVLNLVLIQINLSAIVIAQVKILLDIVVAICIKIFVNVNIFVLVCAVIKANASVYAAIKVLLAANVSAVVQLCALINLS